MRRPALRTVLRIDERSIVEDSSGKKGMQWFGEPKGEEKLG